MISPNPSFSRFISYGCFYEAVQGGADTNELFYAARKIRAGNTEDWHDAFYDLGKPGQGDCR